MGVGVGTIYRVALGGQNSGKGFLNLSCVRCAVVVRRNRRIVVSTDCTDGTEHRRLSLTSCPLIHTAIAAGTSRVAYGPLRLHAFADAPTGLMELVRSYRSTSNKRSCGRSGIDYYAGIENFAIYVDRVFVCSVFS